MTVCALQLEAMSPSPPLMSFLAADGPAESKFTLSFPFSLSFSLSLSLSLSSNATSEKISSVKNVSHRCCLNCQWLRWWISSNGLGLLQEVSALQKNIFSLPLGN
jgi:hypothetical protein